jgi:predicted transcriptional regulator
MCEKREGLSGDSAGRLVQHEPAMEELDAIIEDAANRTAG